MHILLLTLDFFFHYISECRISTKTKKKNNSEFHLTFRVGHAKRIINNLHVYKTNLLTVLLYRDKYNM